MDIYTAVLDTLPWLNFSGASLIPRARWNMVSLPVTPADAAVTAIFPSAASPAFKYDGSYQIQDTLRHGVGYWIDFPSNQMIRIFGDTIATDTIPVVEGWNLIGSITEPVGVMSIASDPPGIVTSSFFGYGGSYVPSDSIYPARGYWVKTAQAGSIILSASPSAASMANRITILPTGEQPPPPPEDVASGRRMPGFYALDNNYPNPFNPATTITFQLAADAHVRLAIFNTLGQEVVRLVDVEERAGYQSAEWNAANTASGIYFARLVVSDGNGKELFADTKKVVLMR
jgi:hypothetical protein